MKYLLFDESYFKSKEDIKISGIGFCVFDEINSITDKLKNYFRGIEIQELTPHKNKNYVHYVDDHPLQRAIFIKDILKNMKYKSYVYFTDKKIEGNIYESSSLLQLIKSFHKKIYKDTDEITLIFEQGKIEDYKIIKEFFEKRNITTTITITTKEELYCGIIDYILGILGDLTKDLLKEDKENKKKESNVSLTHQHFNIILQNTSLRLIDYKNLQLFINQNQNIDKIIEQIKHLHTNS